MKEKLKAWFRSQRSQGITEFALIAPVILLMTFGIIDFGRGLYFYITLQQAANEGARVAVRASYFIDPSGATHTWPTDADVATAVQVHAVTEVLANPCPNGPIPNGGNPVGSAQLPPSNIGLDLHHRSQRGGQRSAQRPARRTRHACRRPGPVATPSRRRSATSRSR